MLVKKEVQVAMREHRVKREKREEGVNQRGNKREREREREREAGSSSPRGSREEIFFFCVYMYTNCGKSLWFGGKRARERLGSFL